MHWNTAGTSEQTKCRIGFQSYEHGNSSVECRTRNLESPGSNPLCYRFEVWAFSFSPQCPSSLSCINEYLAVVDGGGNVSVFAAWQECLPEKSSWCRNEHVQFCKHSVPPGLLQPADRSRPLHRPSTCLCNTEKILKWSSIIIIDSKPLCSTTYDNENSVCERIVGTLNRRGLLPNLWFILFYFHTWVCCLKYRSIMCPSLNIITFDKTRYACCFRATNDPSRSGILSSQSNGNQHMARPKSTEVILRACDYSPTS